MRLLLCAAVTALVLTGCADKGEQDVNPPATELGATVEEPTPVLIGLGDACPMIEAGLPTGMAPAPARWADFGVTLGAVAARSDEETLNAINVLWPAVDLLAAGPTGLGLLDAREGLRSALETMAERCAVAGSSAFQ